MNNVIHPKNKFNYLAKFKIYAGDKFVLQYGKYDIGSIGIVVQSYADFLYIKK